MSILGKVALSRRRPILDAQPRDALELAGVGGDDDQPPGARLAGDEQVVATDRQTHRRQLGAEPPRFARVVEIESSIGNASASTCARLCSTRA